MCKAPNPMKTIKLYVKQESNYPIEKPAKTSIHKKTTNPSKS